jgi:hypothetical protein
MPLDRHLPVQDRFIYRQMGKAGWSGSGRISLTPEYRLIKDYTGKMLVEKVNRKQDFHGLPALAAVRF